MARTIETGHGQLVVCGGYDELCRKTAAVFVAASEQAVRERGRFMVVLAGGKTPAGVYRLLAGEMRNAVPWDKSYVFWSDERCVPPDNPESNYGMAERELLRHVPVPPEHVFRMKGELEPQRAAEEYERALREIFQLAPGEAPRFDLLLLGMGEEGHTASLFPGSEALDEARRLVVAPYVPKVKMYRITLTLPVLNSARAVVMLVAGQNKAATLGKVFLGPAEQLPVQRVRPAGGSLTWIVDEEAARQLRQVA